MNQERPIPDADKQARPEEQASAALDNCYIAPAPLAAVLFDQLEYLVAHRSGECAPDCLDCGRLQQVKNWLMLPFRTAVQPS